RRFGLGGVLDSGRRRGRGVRLRARHEAHLFAHGGAAPRGSFVSRGFLRGGGRGCCGGLRGLHHFRLVRLRHGLGLLNQRGRWLRAAVEIGNGGGCLVLRRRREFVADRSGQSFFASVLASAAPA